MIISTPENTTVVGSIEQATQLVREAAIARARRITIRGFDGVAAARLVQIAMGRIAEVEVRE